MGTSPDLPVSNGRILGRDGKVYNIVNILGGGTPVSDLTYDIDSYAVSSGELIGEDKKSHNIVTILGGGTPVSDRVHSTASYAARSGRVLGEDGKPYNLVDLLQNAATGGVGSDGITIAVQGIHTGDTPPENTQQLWIEFE